MRHGRVAIIGDMTQATDTGMGRDLAPKAQAAYLDARAARASAGRLSALVGKAGTTAAALPGDKSPADWLPDRAPDKDVTPG